MEITRTEDTTTYQVGLNEQEFLVLLRVVREGAFQVSTVAGEALRRGLEAAAQEHLGREWRDKVPRL